MSQQQEANKTSVNFHTLILDAAEEAMQGGCCRHGKLLEQKESDRKIGGKISEIGLNEGENHKLRHQLFIWSRLKTPVRLNVLRSRALRVSTHR